MKTDPVSPNLRSPAPADESDQSDSQLLFALREMADTLTPLWPLRDYVAVNPMDGLTDRPFLAARNHLRTCTDVETLMPLNYYRERYQQGFLTADDIREATRFPTDTGGEISAAQVLAAVRARPTEAAEGPPRLVKTFIEIADSVTEKGWREFLIREVGGFCAQHYDEGVATWAHPWQALPLYHSWRETARHNLAPELRGLSGFRARIRQLPFAPLAAVKLLLKELGVPTKLWPQYLASLAHLLPGWCSWAMRQANEAHHEGRQNEDLCGLVAVLLSYELAVKRVENVVVDWSAISAALSARTPSGTPAAAADDAPVRLILQHAAEIAYRRSLLEKLIVDSPAEDTSERPPIEAVFCIDVRSERLRRHLRTADSRISTGGFAGFFGMPIEYQASPDETPRPHLPAIVRPVLIASGDSPKASGPVSRWRQLRKSACGAFGFVEVTGFLHLANFLQRGWQSLKHSNCPSGRSVPRLHTCGGHEVSLTQKVDLARSILAGLGRREGHARLFVLCGHGAETANNPLNAGLACGACGGHGGAVNARLAADLLNQPEVRRKLADHGMHVPKDTLFVAAEHDTVSDRITILDPDIVPASHQAELRRFVSACQAATAATRRERSIDLATDAPASLLHRHADWSELRHEWGLAGNAAFIAAPRELIRSDLEGRAFLHDYRADGDPDGAVLQQILTGPLVVAHWINMQYYTSTVDNAAFGSCNKTLHNVTGLIGVQSGLGGDLKFGLPEQSVADARGIRHEPLRLQVVVAADRDRIDAVLQAHPGVDELSRNGWLALLAWERAGIHLRNTAGGWSPLRHAQPDAPGSEPGEPAPAQPAVGAESRG